MHVVRIALALFVLLSLTLSTPADPAHTVVPAGNSATLGSTTPPAEDTPQSKLLNGALSKETRNTLQQAVSSSGN